MKGSPTNHSSCNSGLTNKTLVPPPFDIIGRFRGRGRRGDHVHDDSDCRCSPRANRCLNDQIPTLSYYHFTFACTPNSYDQKNNKTWHHFQQGNLLSLRQYPIALLPLSLICHVDIQSSEYRKKKNTSKAWSTFWFNSS